jgi:hypothetical protein
VARPGEYITPTRPAVVVCGDPVLQAIKSKNKKQQPIDEPLPPSNSLFKRTPAFWDWISSDKSYSQRTKLLPV